MTNVLKNKEFAGADSALDNPRLSSSLAVMLKHSHDQLEEAERTINRHEKRIRELEALAATDSLTGLMNRRAFEKALEQEVSRIQRGNSPGAVLVMIDLDRFKGINDTLGHSAGDACLKELAQKLNGLVRLTDAAARMGGDECALLFTHTTAEKLGARLSKIRGELSGLSFEWQDLRVPFAASAGWCEITEGTTATQAVIVADEDLYRQKASRKH
jgi:diguanylate cyclase (GGDEF)-like protein